MSASNKYYFKIPFGTKELDLPFEMKWDFIGQEDSIEMWESDAVEQVVGVAKDFETLRFSHDSYGTEGQTKLNYKFYFFDNETNSWNCDFLAEGFTAQEVYYNSNSFKKSFFKLDFYDTKDTTTQTINFTIILPTNIGEDFPLELSPYLPPVNSKTPDIKLDFNSLNKEGFFIYWMRNKSYLNLDTFYMSAKFFDAKRGVFVRMINTNPSTLPNPNLFDTSTYFYYQVVLDYPTYTYKIFDFNGVRVGEGNPINWYEYVNSI